MKKLALLLFVMFSSFVYSLTIDGNIIKDEVGNEIPIKSYNRIVVLDPGVVETFYMIGAESKIVAIGTGHKTKIYPEDKTSALKNIGHMVNLDFENILECHPDLVILNPMGSKTKNKLQEFKIPVLVNSARSFENILNNTEIYGKLTGSEENASKLINDTKEKLAVLKEKIKAEPLDLKGTILYSTSPLMGFKSTSLPGEILNFLEITNITEGLIGEKPILSQEYVLKENPDFLAGAMMIKNGDNILKDNPVLKQTDAGKNENVFLIDSTKTLRGSPRIFQALEELYIQLKPISDKKHRKNAL
ncbi:ABC transporter substrate-binding protein [Fusobacterium sp.]|uniref:ABC transporter substrate-binding protein n=1 Tax=Fusobacterium sp. TaxID=68766 RepID=UPI00396CAD95